MSKAIALETVIRFYNKDYLDVFRALRYDNFYDFWDMRCFIEKTKDIPNNNAHV